MSITAEEFINQLQQACDKAIQPHDPKLCKNVIFTTHGQELINNIKNKAVLTYNGNLTIENLVISQNCHDISNLFASCLGNKSNKINSLTVSLIIRTNTLSLKGLFKCCPIPKIKLTLILDSDLELTNISELFSQNDINLNTISYVDISRIIHVKNTERHKLKLCQNIDVNKFVSFNGAQLDVIQLFETKTSSGLLNLERMFSDNKYMLSLKKNDIAIMDFTNWVCRNNPIISLNRFLFNSGNIRIVDMSNWNTSNCLSFAYCFANTPQMRKIYIDNWKLKLNDNSPCNYNNISSLDYKQYHCSVSAIGMFENCGQSSKPTSPVKLRANGLTVYLLTCSSATRLTITNEAKNTLIQHLNKKVECLCVSSYKSTGTYNLNITSVKFVN